MCLGTEASTRFKGGRQIDGYRPQLSKLRNTVSDIWCSHKSNSAQTDFIILAHATLWLGAVFSFVSLPVHQGSKSDIFPKTTQSRFGC